MGVAVKSKTRGKGIFFFFFLRRFFPATGQPHALVKNCPGTQGANTARRKRRRTPEPGGSSLSPRSPCPGVPAKPPATPAAGSGLGGLPRSPGPGGWREGAAGCEVRPSQSLGPHLRRCLKADGGGEAGPAPPPPPTPPGGHPSRASEGPEPDRAGRSLPRPRSRVQRLSPSGQRGTNSWRFSVSFEACLGVGLFVCFPATSTSSNSFAVRENSTRCCSLALLFPGWGWGGGEVGDGGTQPGSSPPGLRGARSSLLPLAGAGM